MAVVQAAAKLLRAVEQLVAIATVEQAVQAQAPGEDDLRAERAAVVGERLPQEHWLRAELDLRRPEQAVPVGVLVGIRHHEVAAWRVSGLDALREAPQPEDDRIAERVGLQDPAAHAEGRRVEVDLERLTVHDVCRGRDLHALVAHGPEVLELRAGIDHARGQTAAA